MVVRINPYDISDTFRKFFVNNFKDSADLNENEKNRLVFEKLVNVHLRIELL